jgi:CDP-glucose 4,6-dehydratase
VGNADSRVISGRLPDPMFWSGKRVLLTGHSGFKGGWTALWLKAMGAQVTGFALMPDTGPALFHLAEVERDINSIFGDLRDRVAVQEAVATADPQIVLHMAAQALVRRSIVEPVETFAVNVLGTVHLLETLRRRSAIEAVLVVTSDKVYAQAARQRTFKEDDRLGGKDPYSASKAATELVVSAYGSTYFEQAAIPLATARGGNVIGGGDFAADRLVPDIIRAAKEDGRVELRHPEATRPWQHVLDCTAGYLLFLEHLAAGIGAMRTMNFGPNPACATTVGELADTLISALGAPAGWDHLPDPNSLETEALALDATAARQTLGWRERLAGREGVKWTADWYRAYMRGEDLRMMTLRQIAAYRGTYADSR